MLLKEMYGCKCNRRVQKSADEKARIKRAEEEAPGITSLSSLKGFFGPHLRNIKV